MKSLCGAVKRRATAVAVFHGSSGRHYCSESNVHPLALKAPWCAVHLVYLLSLGKPAANPRVLHARARTRTQNTRALTWTEAYVCTRTRVRYTRTVIFTAGKGTRDIHMEHGTRTDIHSCPFPLHMYTHEFSLSHAHTDARTHTHTYSCTPTC